MTKIKKIVARRRTSSVPRASRCQAVLYISYSQTIVAREREKQFYQKNQAYGQVIKIILMKLLRYYNQ